MNALSPDRMNATERLNEIAAILAAGFIRLKAKQSSGLSAVREKSFVDFPPHGSSHDAVNREAENWQ